MTELAFSHSVVDTVRGGALDGRAITNNFTVYTVPEVSMPKYKFARWSGSAGMLHVSKGQAILADDPVVKQFPDMWADEPTEVVSSVPRSYSGNVFQATAGPGEKRL